MEKINVTCRMTAEDVAFLDKLGTLMDRDRSYLIKKAVADYIALQRWQIEEIEKAVKEADAGMFATEKQVKAAFAELADESAVADECIERPRGRSRPLGRRKPVGGSDRGRSNRTIGWPIGGVSNIWPRGHGAGNTGSRRDRAALRAGVPRGRLRGANPASVPSKAGPAVNDRSSKAQIAWRGRWRWPNGGSTGETAIPLCANMTETLAALFITVEGQEGNSHGKDHEQ